MANPTSPKIEALQQVISRINARTPDKLRSCGQFEDLIECVSRVAESVNQLGTARITDGDIKSHAEGLRRIITSSRKKADELSRRAERDFLRAARERSGWKPSPFDSEIRAKFSGLDQSKKAAAIQSFIEEQNGPAMSAVLDAPSFLTGVGSEDNERFKNQFFQAVTPELWEARRQYGDLFDHTTTALEIARSVAEEDKGNGRK